MKVIALTGGIACGKSTVAKMFESLGAGLIDADQVVHQIYDFDPLLKTEITGHFGTSILDENQNIDRKKLSRLVFENAEELRWLENIVHPAAKRQIEDLTQEARKKNTRLLLVEAALMVETHYYKSFEGLILVKANPILQKNRAQKRDGLSGEEVLQRINQQLQDEEKEKVAHWVIENSSTLEETFEQVKKLYSVILNDSEGSTGMHSSKSN